MQFISTRNTAHPTPHRASLSEAFSRSLAPDGGLYAPETFPRLSLGSFSGLEALTDIARRWLEPFFEGDPLEGSLEEICRNTFSFPILLRGLEKGTAVLELFHGPTGAFKDVGARFLAECLTRLAAPRGMRTILVATSGDTGGAVAAAFHRKPGFEVIILFPKGKVSPRQEKQLASWGDNVRAFAVRGDFDDCQRLAKETFSDEWWARSRALSSANSINLGRLLPQGAYYAAASLWYLRRFGAIPDFVVPSGNLGNATAAMWVKRSGTPMGKIVLAMNANRAVADYSRTGSWRAQRTVPTLANAMDVGNPSNMERVLSLYPTHADFGRDLSVVTVSDAEIRETIREEFSRTAEIWCPHTATAMFARRKSGSANAIVVATAHPAKFEAIVEPLIGQKVLVPPSLAAILTRPSRAEEIEPSLVSLEQALTREDTIG